MKTNANKCSLVLKEIPYLGYVKTREGVKSDPKKIRGMMDLQHPKTTTDCRKLVGMVRYYQDMWKRHYHILAPITEASSGKRVKQIRWTKYIEKSFLDIKRIVLEKTLLNCPDLTIHLTIHIDVSDKQLSAVISQNNKPIVFSVEY